MNPADVLRITPADHSSHVNPSDGVTVADQAGGKVTSVTVTAASGGKVPGALSSGDASWHSSQALHVAQSYKVSATGTTSTGKQVTVTSTFTTLTPSAVYHAMIYEGAGATYGVGMPIMLYFDHAITDKAAVERALTVTTSKPVVGAWYWDDRCPWAKTCLYFRPRDYWPAGTTVTLTANLNGVAGAPGVYGDHDLTQTFKIGQSLIAVGNTRTHYTKIYVDGKLKYNWPMSAGRPSLPTPDGTYLSIDKHNPTRMIGGGKPGSAGYYNELVNYAVRFTFSGSYYHSAPWSVSAQGHTNVSHGCVNLPPADAKIYYGLSVPGDPITIVGSTAAGKWDDGWTPWFLSWSQLLKGSALGEAVQAGPSGSSFVSPSSLPAESGSAPLSTSVTGNYQAGAAI